ncbi:hypothetical protein AAZX31_06G182800 [Glycine max]
MSASATSASRTVSTTPSSRSSMTIKRDKETKAKKREKEWLKDAEVTLYRELWHVCAGPLVTLPREGKHIFYFS